MSEQATEIFQMVTGGIVYLTVLVLVVAAHIELRDDPKPRKNKKAS